MKKFGKIALGLALVLGLTGCGNGDEKDSGSEETSTAKVEENKASTEGEKTTEGGKTIKIGVVGENNEVWEEVIKRYEAATGNKCELVRFSDYVQPNEALESGDIDINSFQHKKYLADYNKENDSDLVAIGDTMLGAFGIYSSKIKDLDELKDGDTVAIPDDPTNGSRALFLLQAAGLIKVKGEAGDAITVDDIIENPKNLEIQELGAEQIARSLTDVTIGCVNDNYALDSGLKPNKDAIFLEDAQSDEVAEYINVIATTKDRENDEDLLDLVKNYYQTDETAKDYDTYTDGAWIPAWK